jgi:hypothetical protein
MNSMIDRPDDELDRAEQSFVAGIREHGWLRTAAIAEDGKPGFSFTTGFELTAAEPELIMFDPPDRVDHQIFWNIFRAAKGGQSLPLGACTADVFSTLPAFVFPVAKRHFADHLGWSRWFYRGDDFRCSQIVWPDPDGHFPWETCFDAEFASSQTDLTEHGWVAALTG